MLQLPGRGLPHRADVLTMLLWAGAASPPHVAAALLPSIAVVLHEVAAAPPPASFCDEAGMVSAHGY